MGVVPRVQSKLSRVLHVHRGMKPPQNLQTLGNTTMKRAIARFRGAREQDLIALFVECLWASQEDAVEGPLWKNTLGRSLGLYDAADHVGGMCNGIGCQQEPIQPPSYICTKTGWSSLTDNRVLNQALARFLREIKVQFVIEDI